MTGIILYNCDFCRSTAWLLYEHYIIVVIVLNVCCRSTAWLSRSTPWLLYANCVTVVRMPHAFVMHDCCRSTALRCTSKHCMYVVGVLHDPTCTPAPIFSISCYSSPTMIKIWYLLLLVRGSTVALNGWTMERPVWSQPSQPREVRSGDSPPSPQASLL